MRTLIDRRVRTRASSAQAWDHLARVESWPSWASHITGVRLDPPGPLTSETVGRFTLHGMFPTRFAMTVLSPPTHWTWRGLVLWLRVDYDHQFEALPDGGCELRFLVRADGLGTGTLGRVFATVYSRNLDRALPLLAAELDELARDRA